MVFSTLEDFLQKSHSTLKGMYKLLQNLPTVHLTSLSTEKSALVIIDMVNGFAREGALKSPRVEALIPTIARLTAECGSLGIARLAFADKHTDASPEFEAYPQHCMSGTTEIEIVDEIKAVGEYLLIPKNSTNGFLEEQFLDWLAQNTDIDTFIIVGDCTDICIQQFAVTLKTWFNKKNEPSRIIVPLNAVDTYDLGMHNGDLLNAVTLYSMMGNGIELVREIEYL